MRRLQPLSDNWGWERGTPVDRHYIERFLAARASAVHGAVLEVGDRRYTERFGRDVSRSEVVDIDVRNGSATFVADLATDDGTLPSDCFDCFILAQTLQYVHDPGAAVAQARRILKPGGTLLCTVPVVSRIGRRRLESEYWRFTPAGCRRLFDEHFPRGLVTVEAFGNMLTSIAFLLGMAAEELSERELAHADVFHPLVVCVQAVRSAEDGD
jgi:SAM-dependent methyltransferase